MSHFYYCVDNDKIGSLDFPVNEYAIPCYSSLFADENAEYLAEEAAEHYWEQNDCNEHNWPKKITIFNYKCEKLGTFSVDVDFSPCFSVCEDD